MRITNARKLSFFIMWLLYAQLLGGQNRYGLMWAVIINPPELPKLEMMHILQAQVCGCISAHPGFPHHKTERETSDDSKSQLNQASWNKTVLKFGSENQLNVHNYLSILFWDFSWSHDLEQVTSLSVWLGVRRIPTVYVPGIEACENYWHMNM